MANSKDIIGAVANGDLNKANDIFSDVMVAKASDAWDSARMDVARTSFDDVTPEVTDVPVDTGITGDPEEVSTEEIEEE